MTIGFILAYPDHKQGERNQRIDTIIIKIVAVLPEWHGKGVDHLLYAECYKAAREHNYVTAIYAFIPEDSVNYHIETYQTTLIRSYRLFRKQL